jgi:hypothetical protein
MFIGCLCGIDQSLIVDRNIQEISHCEVPISQIVLLQSLVLPMHHHHSQRCLSQSLPPLHLMHAIKSEALLSSDPRQITPHQLCHLPQRRIHPA